MERHFEKKIVLVGKHRKMSSFVWEYIYVHIDSDKNMKHYVVLGTCDNITKRFGRWDRNWQDVIDKVPLLSTSLVPWEQLSQKWEKNTRYDIISDQPWKPKWLFPPGAFSSSFPWSRTLPLNKVNSFQWWEAFLEEVLLMMRCENPKHVFLLFVAAIDIQMPIISHKYKNYWQNLLFSR